MTYTGATGEVSAVHQRAGSEPSRQLATERYFDALAEIIASGRQLSEAEWTKFYAENDQYMV